VTTTNVARLNESVICRLYDWINRNHPDDLASIVSPSFIDHSNGQRGPAGMAAAMANLHHAYADLHIEIVDLIAQDDLVAMRWHETGRHVGQFFHLAPTGKPFEARGINLYRVREGMIIESWLGIDPATIRAQNAAQAELASGR
jgi:predicted ester cyclase